MKAKLFIITFLSALAVVITFQYGSTQSAKQDNVIWQIKPQFDGTYDFSEGLAVVKIISNTGQSDLKGNSDYTYINKEGKFITKLWFYDAGNLKDGMAKVKMSVNGKYLWGYINNKGKIVIKPQYEEATDFSEGMAKVEGIYKGLINKEGKPAFTDCFWHDIDFKGFHEGLVAFQISSLKWGFINKKGKVIIEPQFDRVTIFSEGLAGVGIGDKNGYVNKEGKIIIEPQFFLAYEFSEGMAPVHDKNYTEGGYINKEGKVVIDIQYTVTQPFSEGLAAVSKGKTADRKYGYINKEGKVVIDIQFDYLSSFHEGLAVQKKGDKDGFIDKDGKFVIEPIFEDARSFSEGLAAVKKDGKWGYIKNPLKTWK